MVRPQFPFGLLKPAGEEEGLLGGEEGRLDAQAALGVGQVGVAVFGQALIAGLGPLLGDPHEGEPVAQQRRVGGVDVGALLGQGLRLGHHLGDAIPAGAGLGLEDRILGHLGAQLILGLLDAGHGVGILQPREVAIDRLQAVLDAEDLGVDLAGGLGRGLRVAQQGLLVLLQGCQPLGDGEVPGVGHLGQRVLAAGAAGMPRDEGEVAGLQAPVGPVEEVLRVVGLPVLVDPEDGEVQVVAGEGEVVIVAAEEGDLLLGREDQADVRVLLVAVDPVLAALVEVHVLAGEAGLHLHLLLDLLDLDFAGLLGLLLGHAGLHGLVDPVRDVVHGHECEYLQARHLDLLLPGGRGEAVLHVVVILVAHPLDPPAAHVVVGEHQAVGAHEGTRAAGEAQGRQADMVQPGLIRGPAVLRLDLLRGQVVEGPHALLGAEGGTGQDEGQQGQGKGSEAGSHGVSGVMDATIVSLSI